MAEKSKAFDKTHDAKRMPLGASARAAFSGSTLPEWQVGGLKSAGSDLFVDVVETMPRANYVSLKGHGIEHFPATPSDRALWTDEPSIGSRY